MNEIVFILICHFGLEKVLKSEVRKLGLEIKEVVDGEVKVLGNILDIPRLNFNLRTCERVLIEVANFKATTFDELYNGVYAAPIEKYIPVDGSFPITKANQDKNSILHSSTSIQSIVKKAMVEKLKKVYNTLFLPEDVGRYPFRVKMYKNIASIRLDTTGDSLHKRGYRIKSGLAPIEETLAASLIKLTDFADKKIGISKDEDGNIVGVPYSSWNHILVDPFCGSGTILIEAAMIAANIPPSIDRAFVSETWGINSKNSNNQCILNSLTRQMWDDAKNEAISKIDNDRKSIKSIKLFGFDIDPDMIKIAKENAFRAGVLDMIHFETLPVSKLAEAKVLSNIKNGIIITNPPYGERLEDKEKIIPIYQDLKKSYDKLKGFDLNVITSFDDAEKYLGKSDKNRKLYNGMIKTYFYSYLVNHSM